MDTPVQSTQKQIVRREPLQIGGGVVPRGTLATVRYHPFRYLTPDERERVARRAIENLILAIFRRQQRRPPNLAKIEMKAGVAVIRTPPALRRLLGGTSRNRDGRWGQRRRPPGTFATWTELAAPGQPPGNRSTRLGIDAHFHD